MFRHKRINLTTGVILALVLTIALAPVVVAQTTPQPPPPDPPPEEPSTTPAPPPGGGGAIPPPPGSTATATATAGVPPPPGATATATPDSGGMMPPSAPAWPPPGLLVTHAATQVQLAPVGDGLHAYLIGSDGTGHSGPYIDSFSNLAQQHAGVATLWSGTNPGTGKSVTITYLPADNKIRISTYYPDTQYDVNKPYVFTVDSGHNVVHEQW